MTRRVRRLVLLAAPLALVAGCRAESIAFPDGLVVTGDWNAQHLSLTLGSSGGTTEYDCAHGTLAAPVRLDAKGRFDVPGTHTREHGGPIREGEEPDSRPARYLGRLEDGVLSMRVVVEADTLGPFRLRRDGRVQLVKCL